jgi:hypothetical protein
VVSQPGEYREVAVRRGDAARVDHLHLIEFMHPEHESEVSGIRSSRAREGDEFVQGQVRLHGTTT